MEKFQAKTAYLLGEAGNEYDQGLINFFEQAFTAAERRPGHETTHRYSLAEFGLDPHDIHRRLAGLFDEYHWDNEEKDAHVS